MRAQVCRHAVGLVLLVLLACAGRWASAEPATAIRDNGDPANRVDLVVLGDGYAFADLGKFATDVENLTNGLFAQEPFLEYRNFFNVHRVDVISRDSGVDHPERNVFKRTRLDATYNCGGIQRAICVDVAKVNAVVDVSVAANARDIVLVLVNDAEYGGLGGFIAVASTHAAVIDLVLHELGHSFGLLADEYETSPPACDTSVEPREPNVTLETNRNLVKWNQGGGPPSGWVEPSTPIPTFGATAGVPGLYDGARYCTAGEGMYRPTFDSKMRTLTKPFEQVNEQELVKRIYNFVSPLDTSAPPGAQLATFQGEVVDFEVSVPAPSIHALTVAWFVDGQVQAATDLAFSLDTTGLEEGSHSVTVEVQDPTSKVRHDPTGVLFDQRVWNVAVSIPIDSDGDGTFDHLDSDDDNDGVLDTVDAFPLDATESVDTDSDGVGNNADTDDDNDGVPDTVEINAGTNPLVNEKIVINIIIQLLLED